MPTWWVYFQIFPSQAAAYNCSGPCLHSQSEFVPVFARLAPRLYCFLFFLQCNDIPQPDNCARPRFDPLPCFTLLLSIPRRRLSDWLRLFCDKGQNDQYLSVWNNWVLSNQKHPLDRARFISFQLPQSKCDMAAERTLEYHYFEGSCLLHGTLNAIAMELITRGFLSSP